MSERQCQHGEGWGDHGAGQPQGVPSHRAAIEVVEGFLNAVPGVEKAVVDSGITLLKSWLEVYHPAPERF
jgi:polyphosphate kinase 2 (PPK2 family)